MVNIFTVISDHQALISALNASERSKTGQSRLTRWLDRLIPFHFDIKHLAASKMGLIDYISQNPFGLAIPRSEYDEEFVVESIRTFINNLEMIDSVILNNLANQNKAPYELIKKREKHKGLLNAASNTQLAMKHSKHFATGHCQTKNTNQSHSTSAKNQSTLFRSLSQQYQSNSKNSVHKISFQLHNNAAMSRKEINGFKGGFIPPELKSSEPRGRNESTENWQGSSDRKESLSDPRWHKRPRTKEKKGNPEVQKSPQQEHDTQTVTPLLDAREVLSTKKIDTSKKSNFPKITFTKRNTSGNRTDRITSGYNMRTTPTQSQSNTTTANTQTFTSEPRNTATSTQTSGKSSHRYLCQPRRPEYLRTRTTDTQHSTMGSTALQASHEMITEELVATVEKATNTVESEEDTTMFRQRLQRVLGVRFIAAATKKDRNHRPLINFVKKRDWEAIKASYAQYWYKIRNKLHVRQDCLLIDERIVIPTQLRQTVLDSLHLTHPGLAAMLGLSNHVWFPHIHRPIVQMAQNCKHCTEKGKNLKPIIGKKHSFKMEPEVEPNEEVRFDFVGPLPDELNRDAYILVAIDKWSKFPTAKIVTNTRADIALKLCNGTFQRTGYPER